MSEPLVQLGRPRPGVTYGHSSHPNDRAPYAKHVVVFTSGKGGVGKSTVAVNVAVALAQMGKRVGILDADVHGPSIPRLLGVLAERMRWNDRDKIEPIENFGLRIMSVGLTTPESDTPLVWRSSVATSALIQLLDDVDWGELDFLIIDMPPGTGDVQLTIAQELRIRSAVVVTTPQPVATDDVRRAIRMLLEVGVKVAGVVENMSYLEVGGQRIYPFGRGGGRALSEDYGVPFLGEIPLDPEVGSMSDSGTPVAAVGTESQRAPFVTIAQKLA